MNDSITEDNERNVPGEEAEEIRNQIAFARITARIALWTAVGIVLAGIERLIPTPFPWIKLGLANGAALIALYSLGWGAALTVNLLRVIAVAVLLGTWSNPTFILSLGGAVLAVLMMAVVRHRMRNWIGPIGVSAAGAWVHMFTQFALASILIVRHHSLMLLAGPSLIAAIISGILIGWLVGEALRRIPKSILQ